jgi:hypothetical protein
MVHSNCRGTKKNCKETPVEALKKGRRDSKRRDRREGLE